MENNVTKVEMEICDDINEQAYRIVVFQMEYTGHAEFLSIQSELAVFSTHDRQYNEICGEYRRNYIWNPIQW